MWEEAAARAGEGRVLGTGDWSPCGLYSQVLLAWPPSWHARAGPPPQPCSPSLSRHQAACQSHRRSSQASLSPVGGVDRKLGDWGHHCWE